MNKKETARLLQLLVMAYPNFYKKNDQDELKLLNELWLSCFRDNDYSDVAKALKYYISTDTTGYPPVIGKLKEAIYKMTEPNQLTSDEAWSAVKEALGRSLYNSKGEFEKLPENVKKVLGGSRTLYDWARDESGKVNTVIASTFKKSYKELMNHKKEVAMLPNDIKPNTDLEIEDLKKKIALELKDNDQPKRIAKLPKKVKVDIDREAILKRIAESKKKREE